MYGLVSIHTENYFPLSDITWDNNKVPYAEKHGYELFYTNDFYGKTIGYTKIHLVNSILKENPHIEWLWWTGTDTVITNTEIKIEHKIHDDYHFIMSVDFNNINCDSFLVRNSPEGREIMQSMVDSEEEYSKHWDSEQRAFSVIFGLPTLYEPWTCKPVPKLNEKYKDIVYIANQTYMNSYDYSVYHNDHPQSRTKKDVLGFNGEWKKGDWLIHFPGTTFEQKLSIAKQYILEVI